MKRFTTLAFLVSSILFANNLLAQQQLAVNSTSKSFNNNVSAASFATPSESKVSESNTLSEGTLALLKYLKSDQYVFDNLSSLKKLYTIPDIYFDLDQAVISKEAEETLKDLADLLNERSEIKVAVTAHCDSRMLAYNANLAVKRALAAKDYLVSRGIDENRIVIEKNGRPGAVNPCSNNPGCSLADQKLNRKTEFNIIVNDKNLAHLRAYDE